MGYVVELAAQAARLGVSVNIDRLYNGTDPAYRVFVRGILARVGELNREDAERNQHG